MSDRRDKPQAGPPTPSTARAWSELVKDLKPGEDPFFYDWRGRPLSEKERSERLQAFRDRVGNDRRGPSSDNGWVPPPSNELPQMAPETIPKAFANRPTITADVELHHSESAVEGPLAFPWPRWLRVIVVSCALIVLAVIIGLVLRRPDAPTSDPTAGAALARRTSEPNLPAPRPPETSIVPPVVPTASSAAPETTGLTTPQLPPLRPTVPKTPTHVDKRPAPEQRSLPPDHPVIVETAPRVSNPPPIQPVSTAPLDL